MLGRRAAGSLPRGQRSMDLIIPICKPKNDKADSVDVSMILVQVKNHKRGFTNYSPSSLTKGRASNVFDYEWLRQLKPIVRVYMSLRGHRTKCRRYVHDVGDSHVLVVEGVGPWSCTTLSGETQVQVLTKSTSEALEALLEPWWKVIDAVTADVSTRDADINEETRFGMSADELKWTALRPLTTMLVLNGKPPPSSGVDPHAADPVSTGSAAPSDDNPLFSSQPRSGRRDQGQIARSPCTTWTSNTKQGARPAKRHKKSAQS